MLPIGIVGAGWAGLSAAHALAHAGKPVVLFEQSPLLGGRARNAQWQPRYPLALDESLTVDNGQHLLMGAYAQTLTLIKSLSSEQQFSELFTRSPVSLRDTNGFKLTAHPSLPAPLHLAWALSFATGLSLTERFALVWLMTWLQIRRWHLGTREITVQQLMQRTRQPESLCKKLWYPLCISALNTPAATASAQVFANVLKDTLGSNRSDSDFIVARAALGDTLPKLIADRLTNNLQCTVYTSERVVSIAAQTGSDQCLITTDKQTVAVQSVVLASPWSVTQNLLRSAGLTVPAADLLVQLPICTVYLYSKHDLKEPLQAPLMLNEDLASGHFGHWLFDLGSTRGGGRLRSVVISGPGPHQDLSRQQIGAAVKQQLSKQIGLIESTECFVIMEKNATFACTAGLKRPQAVTDHSRVKLAGDYYESPYPATLETAVRSGLSAARDLLV